MLSVLCIRGSGEYPTQPVVDTLLGDVLAAVELGRNIINDGAELLEISQTIAGEHDITPGDVIHVALENGTIAAYQVTGVSIGYVDGIPSMAVSGVLA
jgi:hypothetical protein